jgi:hypothetical protein
MKKIILIAIVAIGLCSFSVPVKPETKTVSSDCVGRVPGNSVNETNYNVWYTGRMFYYFSLGIPMPPAGECCYIYDAESGQVVAYTVCI